MAVKREAITQPTAESQSHHLPKATGFTPSPARGKSHNGTGLHRQLRIRAR